MVARVLQEQDEQVQELALRLAERQVDLVLASGSGDSWFAAQTARLAWEGFAGLPFEENGRRTQICRVPDEVWYAQLVLSPSPQTIPPTLRYVHFIGRGDPNEEKWVQALDKAGVRLSAEPIIDASTTPEEIASLKRCLAHFEIFSPGLSETGLLVGQRSMEEQLRALAALGPRVIALRQGAAGSVDYKREADRFWRAPAAEAEVVDVTGAGNAY